MDARARRLASFAAAVLASVVAALAGTASGDTSDGPSDVTTDGKMPMVKGAKYSRSSGDEAGTIGGILSSSNMSECEYMLYSFDVKFEGKNVCRMGDPLFHNKKNMMG